MKDIETSARAGTPWGLVLLLGSLTALGPVAMDMYLPSLPAMGRDLHASPGQAQATVATFLAGMAVGQFFYGPASDRFGRRGPILVGVTIFVIASMACLLTRTPEQLLICRFVQGLGACAGPVVGRAVVRDRFSANETARVLSLLMLVMGLAPILAPLLGGFLLAFGGWRLIFGVMAAFGLAVGTAAFLRLKESRSAETSAQAWAESPLAAYAALLRQRRIVGYVLSGALSGATLFTYIAGSPGLLIGTYGVSPQAFGWVFGLNAAGVIGASQVNRWALRRRSPDQILAVANRTGVALALALVVATLADSPWTVLPMLFLLLATFGFTQGNATAAALSVDPRRGGSISALLGGGSFIAGALAASVGGLVHDGTARPMAVTMALCLIGSFVALNTLVLRRAPAP